MEIQVDLHSNELFTEYQYEQFIKQYPNESYYELLRRAEEGHFGFAFVYIYHVRERIAEQSREWRRAQNAYIEHTMSLDKMMERLNQIETQIRREIDTIMQKYVHEKNGVIDRWPAPITREAFAVDESNDDHAKQFCLSFEYFGSVYEADREMGTDPATGKKQRTTTIRRDSQLVYHEEYYAEFTKEYKNWLDRIVTLEDTIKKWKTTYKENNISGGKRFIIALPTIITIIYALLWIYWTLAGVENLTEIPGMATLIGHFKGEDKVAKVLAAIPMILIGIGAVLWYIVALIGSVIGAELIAVIVVGIMLVMFGYMLSAMISDNVHKKGMDPKKLKAIISAGKAAKKELESIYREPGYIHAKEDYAVYEKQEDELAEKWHKEWYDHCSKYWKKELDEFIALVHELMDADSDTDDEDDDEEDE